MADDMTEQDARRIAEAVGEHLGQVLQPLNAITRTLERMNDRLDSVDRRVIHLEASHHKPEIDALKAAVAKLETELDTGVAKLESRLTTELAPIRTEVATLSTWRAQMAGAATLFGWVRSSWPLVAGAVAVLAAWLKFGGDAP